MLQVVVFTGGRGSSVLSRRLLAHRDVNLVLAINGYDDGASTGEVRRFLGGVLGPSDFRKNASRIATATESCPAALATLLDERIPAGIDAAGALADLDAIVAGHRPARFGASLDALGIADWRAVQERLEPFLEYCRASGRPFQFGDCALGNLIFAGCILRQRRAFNTALDDYAALLRLPAGLIENVTDGTNAHLVGLDSGGRVLGTEEEIVTVPRQTRIEDLFLIDAPLDAAGAQAITALGADGARTALDARSVTVGLNPRLARRLDTADVIVYAPGTQHSSLYPSYMTPGLTDHIARNLRATKLLITNLESDVEIAGENAVTLVERALHYLTDKGRHPRPAPCLITHYVLNDPNRADPDRPLVPLGQVETLEDPRLVRIGSYEDGVTGRHDASKVLEPFIATRLTTPARPRIAVLLYGATSANKLAQSLLEIARAGAAKDADLTVFATSTTPLEPEFRSQLPFVVELLATSQETDWAIRNGADAHEFDFVALFESSGMYRGEDLAGMLQYLGTTRLDAIWGSRRLSVKDIREAYRQRSYTSRTARQVSRVGSHVLSLSYLLLHGRYVTDTLSGVRIIRAAELSDLKVPLSHPLLNQYILSGLLRRRADLLEVPVQYLPVPREQRPVTVAAGVASFLAIVWQKLMPFAGDAPPL